jgi:hypothetical protein
VLDGALLLLVALGVLRVLLRRAALGELGNAPLAIPWGLHLLLVFGLLVLRARSSPPSAVSPGSWPGREGLAPCAAFLLVLALIPPSRATLGADGGVYLEQLHGVLLRGNPFTHPGAEPGVVVLLAPFYLLAHGVAVGARAFGIDVAANGESEPYLDALRLGAAAYGLLAALFAQRAAARFVGPLLAAVCAAAFWLASTLYHYTVAEPVMAHAPGAAAASLLLLLWLRAREAPERAGRWVAVAAAGGLLVTIQRYDAYLLLPALLSASALVWSRWRRGEPAGRRRTVLTVALAAAAFGLAVLPLVLLTLASPDHFLLSPEVIRTRMLADWARPHVGPLLFSSNGGWFAWTPLALPAVFGLVLLARREPGVGLALLATLALGVYLLASTPTWSAGLSFGARRLTEAYPLLVVGLCVTAEALQRRPWVLGTLALALFVLQNVLFSEQVQRGRVIPGNASSFLTVVQGSAADLHRALGHPGSWPANWLFAWKHGVSPGRFDDLFGRVPRPAWVLGIGTPEDAAVLGRGWSRVEEGAPGRWALGEDATLFFTLTAPVDRRLRLRGAAPRDPGARTQTVWVEVNGRTAGSLSLTPEGRAWEAVVPAADWQAGQNEIRFRAAWRLSRQEAWAAEQVPFAAWRLEEIAVGPVD